MPTETLGAGSIALDTGISLKEVAFVAFRVCGYTQEDAYKLIRPKVSAKSAQAQGSRMEGRLRDTIKRTSLEQAIAALGDVITVETAVHGEDGLLRFAAAREINKVSGRYRESVDASDLATILASLSGPGRAHTEEPDGLEEVSAIVDLTRPGGEGS